jgi:transporter family-2 protein
MRSMAGVLWPLVGMIAGAALALQAPVNSALARGLGQPVAAAAFSFLSGAIVLGIVSAGWAKMQGTAIDFRAPALWLFVVGGCLGGFYVTCVVVLVPKLGAAALIAFVVAGQLLAGLLIDRVGLLGVAVRELTLGRIAGAVLLITGALMIRRF